MGIFEAWQFFTLQDRMPTSDFEKLKVEFLELLDTNRPDDAHDLINGKLSEFGV